MNEYPSAISVSLDAIQKQRLEQLSDEEFWNYARQLAHAVPSGTQPEEYLECTLSQGRCLVPLTALYEVVLPPHNFALLPAIPQWMIGIIAWRGETIACIDLNAYLVNAPSEHGTLLHEGVLLVVKHAEIPLGLLVSAIGQATSLQHYQDPQTSSTAIASEYFPSRAAIAESIQGDALVLDVSILLADVVQQLGTVATNG
ncbi:MAG: hypothetical protein NVS4B7_06360 [Ktedonobacteraceae bacterium]